MRNLDAIEEHQSSAAAPYVATLQLAAGATLSLALPGVGERVLASRGGGAGELKLESIPPSSAAHADPGNPVSRIANWAWQGRSEGLRLRHEKGLGPTTALGDKAAAACAAALAVATLTGKSLRWQQVAAWLADDGAEPATDGDGAVAAAWHGGAWFDLGQGPLRAAPSINLRLVVIMPGEGVLPVRYEGAELPLPPLVRAGLADLDLRAMGAAPTRPRLDHPAWQAAAKAARAAGAAYVHVANGGHSLVALTDEAERAGAIRVAAIDAFAAEGIWSRGRAGPLNLRGALDSLTRRPNAEPGGHPQP